MNNQNLTPKQLKQLQRIVLRHFIVRIAVTTVSLVGALILFAALGAKFGKN